MLGLHPGGQGSIPWLVHHKFGSDGRQNPAEPEGTLVKSRSLPSNVHDSRTGENMETEDCIVIVGFESFLSILEKAMTRLADKIEIESEAIEVMRLYERTRQ
jgi:hypothetical protein